VRKNFFPKIAQFPRVRQENGRPILLSVGGKAASHLALLKEMLIKAGMTTIRRESDTFPSFVADFSMIPREKRRRGCKKEERARRKWPLPAIKGEPTITNFAFFFVFDVTRGLLFFPSTPIPIPALVRFKRGAANANLLERPTPQMRVWDAIGRRQMNLQMVAS